MSREALQIIAMLPFFILKTFHFFLSRLFIYLCDIV